MPRYCLLYATNAEFLELFWTDALADLIHFLCRWAEPGLVVPFLTGRGFVLSAISNFLILFGGTGGGSGFGCGIGRFALLILLGIITWLAFGFVGPMRSNNETVWTFGGKTIVDTSRSLAVFAIGVMCDVGIFRGRATGIDVGSGSIRMSRGVTLVKGKAC